MKPIVYIDILFMLNLCINFILLWLTAKLCGIKTTTLRIVVGAGVGALYCVFMFFPALTIYYSVLFKLVFSCGIISISMPVKSWRMFFKALAAFYAVTVCLGGGCLALFYFSGVGNAVGTIVSNGIIYMNMPWEILAIALLIGSAALRIVWRTLAMRFGKQRLITDITISYCGRQVGMNAFLDTGNDLFDPYSGMPVIIAEYAALREILPAELRIPYESAGQLDLPKMQAALESSRGRKVRLLPFSSIGTESGLLLGFRPDSVEAADKRHLSECMVAIYDRPLARDGSFCALMHPQLYENST